jgi:hypothetical protein
VTTTSTRPHTPARACARPEVEVVVEVEAVEVEAEVEVEVEAEAEVEARALLHHNDSASSALSPGVALLSAFASTL